MKYYFDGSNIPLFINKLLLNKVLRILNFIKVVKNEVLKKPLLLATAFASSD